MPSNPLLKKDSFLIIVSVRDPASLVKPLKESATDEEKAAREVKLAESEPKVSVMFSTATSPPLPPLSH